jgi:hypothetical protein
MPRPKGKSAKPSKASTNASRTKTASMERINIWLPNIALGILREWRDTESLDVPAFCRKAILDAIDRKADGPK